MEKHYGEYILGKTENGRVTFCPVTDSINQEPVYVSDRPNYTLKEEWRAVIDNYNPDSTQSAKGSMNVYVGEENCIAYYNALKSTTKREQFYETCLLIAHYYNLVGVVEVDNRSSHLIQYFIDHGGGKYLKSQLHVGESGNFPKNGTMVDGDKILAFSEIAGKRDFTLKTINEDKVADPQTILEEAQSAVYGDRNSDYGTVTENFQTIADLWATVLKTKVTPEQVGLCMVQVKVARQMFKAKRDNLVDISGYAACLEKLSKGE